MGVRSLRRVLSSRPPAPCEKQVCDLARRKWRVLRSPDGLSLLESLAEIEGGLTRWWAAGAFREKSFMYGAQYLAGRRAPPSFRI